MILPHYVAPIEATLSLNTDTHGCLGLMSISRTRVGFFLLSFPKFSVGNLNDEEVRFHHEGHEEHEGLGLMVVIL